MPWWLTAALGTVGYLAASFALAVAVGRLLRGRRLEDERHARDVLEQVEEEHRHTGQVRLTSSTVNDDLIARARKRGCWG